MIWNKRVFLFIFSVFLSINCVVFYLHFVKKDKIEYVLRSINVSVLDPESSYTTTGFISITEPPDIPGKCAAVTFGAKEEYIANAAVPKLIHFVYKNTRLPEPYAKYLQKAVDLNPDYQVILWTDKAIDKMVKTEYSSKYYQLYKKFPIPIQKSDVSRLFIVYMFGGIYLDLDVECVRPFNSGLLNMDKVSLLFDKEQPLMTRMIHGRPFTLQCNAFVARPKHPFFLYVIDRLNPNSTRRELDKTGPFFVHAVLNIYNTTGRPFEQQVTFASPEIFSPVVDVGVLHPRCGGTNYNATDCVEMRKLPTGATNNTICIHRFMKLGYNNRRDAMKQFDVCANATNLKTYDGLI